MPSKPRNFQIGHSYHITTRCNNREFKLSRRECREVFLYAIKKVSTKYNFRLYALCIMSNHVHCFFDNEFVVMSHQQFFNFPTTTISQKLIFPPN